MGYGSYQNYAGRECGYLVVATCDNPVCGTLIDRGMDYLCGTVERIGSGEGPGCSGYFCEKHRGYVGELTDLEPGGNRRCISLCDACKVDPRTVAMLVHEDEEAWRDWKDEVARLAGDYFHPEQPFGNPKQSAWFRELFDDGKTPDEAWKFFLSCYAMENQER